MMKPFSVIEARQTEDKIWRPSESHLTISKNTDLDVGPSSSSTSRRFKNRFNLTLKGLIYSAVSSFFFSIVMVIIKFLDYIQPGEHVWFRYLGIGVFALPVVLAVGEKLIGHQEQQSMLVLRGLTGAFGALCRFYAYQSLPMAVASVITFSMPVLVLVFASLILQEPCGYFNVVMAVLSLFGIILITKAPHAVFDLSENSTNWAGVAMAVISTVFDACNFIIVRKARSVHYAVVLLHMSSVGVIAMSVVTPFIGKLVIPRCGLDMWLIFVVGLFSFAGQSLLTRALQLEQAGPVSVVRAASDIALSFAWQVTIFGDVPDIYAISGGLLVLCSIGLTGLRNWALSLPADSSARSAMGFITR